MPILEANALEFISRSPEQTRRIGARLGALLHGGEVIALEGNLGAGKTMFAQGVGLGWGADAHLTSPTFILMRRHTRPADDHYLYHIDLYRLASPVEAAGLGLDEVFDDERSVCLVEWADRAPSLFPEEHFWVSIRWLEEHRRSLIFCASGERYHALLRKLRREILGR